MTHLHSTQCRRARRAFTLVELLGVVALIGVFTVASVALFRSATRWTVSAQRHGELRRTTEALVERLRADVWTSYEVKLGNERTAVLRGALGRSTVWLIARDAETGGQTIRRNALLNDEVIDEQTWRVPDIGVTLGAAPGGLTITWGAADGDEGAAGDGRALTLVSQVIIEAEGGR